MSSGKDIGYIRRALFSRGESESFHATVRTCNESLRSCTVEIEGVTYDDVALYAVENQQLKGVFLLPKKDSQVIVSRIGGSNELYVSMFSEVDKVMISIGDDMTMLLTNEGFELKASTTTVKAVADGAVISRGSSGLKKTLGDLCDAIKAITVPTGVGASGVPVNSAQFDAIKQGLNDYLIE